MRARRSGLLLLIVSLAAWGCGGSSTSEPTGSGRVRLTFEQAPQTVTSIRLAVTGEGMTPIETVISPASAAIMIEVPAGLRTFEVTVEAKGRRFSGRTSQRIEAGRDNLVVITVALNEPPTVRIDAERTTADSGEPIGLTCRAADPDGDAARLVWSASGGGLAPTQGARTTWSAQDPGRYVVTCTATDPKGAAGSDSIELRVGGAVPAGPNRPPTVRVDPARATVNPGQAIDLGCEATDPDGDAVRRRWSASGGSLFPTEGARTTWSAQTPGRYAVTCTATDSRGAAASDSAEIDVAAPLSVTVLLGPNATGALVTSAPAGIACSQGTCTAFFPVGTTVELTATSTQAAPFGGWGGACAFAGANPRCVLTIASPTAVTATFGGQPPPGPVVGLFTGGAASDAGAGGRTAGAR